MTQELDFDLKVLNNFLSTLRGETSDWEQLLKDNSEISSLVNRLNHWYAKSKEELQIAPLKFSESELEYLASPFLDQMEKLVGVSIYKGEPHSHFPILEKASEKGYLVVFQWIVSEYKLDLTNILLGPSIYFERACVNGHLEMARWLYQKYDYMVNVDVAFLWSCASGKVPIVQWLYTLGIDIEYLMQDGPHSLVCASANGHLDVVKWICTNIPRMLELLPDAFEYTCMNGHLETARWIYDFDSRRVISQLNTSFFRACAGGHLTIAQWLWSLGPIDTSEVHIRFEDICDTKNIELIRWLVEVCGISPDYANSYALIHAIEENSKEVADYLFGLWKQA